MKRFIPALIVIIILGAWIYLDVVRDRNEEVEALPIVPVASISDPASLDSAWYCPVGTRDVGGFADNQVNISNLADTEALAKVTVLTGDGIGSSQELELAPNSSQSVKASEVDPLAEGESNLAAMQVEITGGNGAVTHIVDTEVGTTEATCSTRASESWYFATGRVKEGSKSYIALMNPFAESISVDVSLQDYESVRSREVEAWQGLIIFGNSVRLLELHEAPGLGGREHLGAVIKTRSGRIIAERLQIVDEIANDEDGEEPLEDEVSSDDEEPAEDEDEDPDQEENSDDGLKVLGASLQLGAQNPSTDWFFTAGRVNKGDSHLITIYNPAANNNLESFDENVADVLLEIWPTNPDDKDEFVFFPISREVRAGNLSVVDLNNEVRRLGFPVPFDFSIQVKSQNGIPVVAERWQFANQIQDGPGLSELDFNIEEPQLGDYVEPVVSEDENPNSPNSMTNGLATSNGIDFLPNSAWVVPWISTPTSDSTWLTIYSFENETEILVEYETSTGTQELPVTIPRMNGRVFVSVPVLSTGSSTSGGSIKINSNKDVYVEAQVISEEINDVVMAVPVIKTIKK